MNRTILSLVLALGLVGIAGCGETSPTTQSSTAPAASGSTAAKPLADADLPVPADFEEEAEKQITPATYKQELDALEKEVDAN